MNGARSRRADLSDVLFALADPTRLRIVEEIAQAPRRASELAVAVGASRPSMSRHLRILREAGVVRDEGDARDGRATLVGLEHAPFERVRAFLDEIEGFWSAQLGSFQALAEARVEARSAPTRKRSAS